jgi:hypothetical protein
MTKLKKYSSANKKKLVAEPQTTCLAKKNLADVFEGIHISSFEQQENDLRNYSLSLTPVERMHYLQQLIKASFGKKVYDKKLWDKKIVIDKIG